MERLTTGSPAPTHDLIRLREPIALAADGPAPSWVEAVLRRTPWVVVRRGQVRDRMAPVGVRGLTRSQRFAALVAVAEEHDRLSPARPWPILDTSSSRNELDAVPTLTVHLARSHHILARPLSPLGPATSSASRWAVTGTRLAAHQGDLDLFLRQDRRVEPNEAIALLRAWLDY